MSCLNYDSFVAKLETVLSLAGFHPQDYCGHSFHRGGCSFAFQLGILPLLIKLRGDWKSNAYERYVFISDTVSIKVVIAIAASSAV